MTQRHSEAHTTFLCKCDLIYPDGDEWRDGTVALRYDLSYWQSTFAKRSDLSKQQIMTQPRTGATGTQSALRYNLSYRQTTFAI